MKLSRWILAFIVISWIGQAAHAQSLADVARRERERQKSIESRASLSVAGSTVTSTGTSEGIAVTTSAGTAGTAEKPSGITDNKGRDEKYWRSTFEKARQDLKRSEDRLKLLDLKMNDLTARLYREGIYTEEMEIRKELADTQKAQEEARKDVAAKQQRISDLEEELRRSGGPAGWAR